MLVLELTIRITRVGSIIGIKLELEEGWKSLEHFNVVNVFNDMKGFCCLDLVCSAMFWFTINC